MEHQYKEDAINDIRNLSPECVTKNLAYIDDKELVCFNGAIALPYLSVPREREEIEFLNDEIPEELAEIYDNELTLRKIDDVHREYIKNEISFDRAKELVIDILERFE